MDCVNTRIIDLDSDDYKHLKEKLKYEEGGRQEDCNFISLKKSDNKAFFCGSSKKNEREEGKGGKGEEARKGGKEGKGEEEGKGGKGGKGEEGKGGKEGEEGKGGKEGEEARKGGKEGEEGKGGKEREEGKEGEEARKGGKEGEEGKDKSVEKSRKGKEKEKKERKEEEEEAKSQKEMSFEDKAENIASDEEEDGSSGKEKGNKAYAKGEYGKANEYWMNSIRSCKYILSKKVYEGKQEEEIKEMLKSLNLNMSIGHLKLENYSDCIHYCNEVLKEEEFNIKALFRKAQALFLKDKYDDSLVCVDLLLQCESRNAAALLLRSKILKSKISYEKKEKRMARNMFDNLESSQRKTDKQDLSEKRKKQTTRLHSFINMLSNDPHSSCKTKIITNFKQFCFILKSTYYISCLLCKRRFAKGSHNSTANNVHFNHSMSNNLNKNASALNNTSSFSFLPSFLFTSKDKKHAQ